VSETEAWGSPSWLPPGVRRAAYLESQEEAREARQAERSRAERAERCRDEALTAAWELASQRGEYASIADRLSGNVPSRTAADILQAAREAADREDLVAAARASRGQNEEQVHCFVDEPRLISSGRSAWKMPMYWRARKFAAARRAARAAAEAEAHRADYGYVCDFNDRTGFR
jgi:hypothetical protein